MIGNVGAYFDRLTYSSNHQLAVGTIVEVTAGKKSSLGVIIETVPQPDFECKPINKVIIDHPIPSHLIAIHDWLADYYSTKSGIVWQSIIPSSIKTTPRTKQGSTEDIKTTPTIPLNDQQASAAKSILGNPAQTTILHGITGSGKTNVYKKVASEVLSQGQSAIILVPEISLTAQLVKEFTKVFGHQVIVTHSRMTPRERNIAWRKALFSTEPVLIIGPRSAIFAPIGQLGLIVIDESHEPTYKQETSPRYHTTTLAAKLSQITGARLVLGSATPTISDYYLAEQMKRPIIKLDQLASTGAVRPTVKIVDISKRDNFSRQSRIFSSDLLSAMNHSLELGQQVLLFHNRRGTAGLAMCDNCGWIVNCPNCYIPLTLHHDKYQLVCHLCGHHQKPPSSCPDCHTTDISYKGIGTKRIEEEVAKIYPHKTIARFDGDTEKGAGVHELYEDLYNGKIDIIIGTQTIAKGLDLPNLSAVGIVQADAGLALPDFSASERTFQLIAQAAGRVGRNSLDTTAIIQSYRPDEPAVKFGAAQDYRGFYEHELVVRKHNHFPPFCYMLKISTAYKTETGAVRAIGALARELRRSYGSNIKILGPAPSFYERLRGLYRWQIIIRAPKRAVLVEIANNLPNGKWQFELDPTSLL